MLSILFALTPQGWVITIGAVNVDPMQYKENCSIVWAKEENKIFQVCQTGEKSGIIYNVTQ